MRRLYSCVCCGFTIESRTLISFYRSMHIHIVCTYMEVRYSVILHVIHLRLTLTLSSMTSVCASNQEHPIEHSRVESAQSNITYHEDTCSKMSSILAPSRTMLSFQCHKLIARTAPATYRRAISTLPSNKHIVSDSIKTTGS